MGDFESVAVKGVADDLFKGLSIDTGGLHWNSCSGGSKGFIWRLCNGDSGGLIWRCWCWQRH